MNPTAKADLAVAHELVSKAKLGLSLTSKTAFFAHICMCLELSYTDQVSTAAVTAKKQMFINPTFIKQFDAHEIEFILMHEISHIVYEHVNPDRHGDRDHTTWNEAGDYVINQDLQDVGFKLIDHILIDSAYKGLTTEEVYDLLIKDKKSNPSHTKSNVLGQDLPDPSKGTGDSTPQNSDSSDDGGEDAQVRDALNATPTQEDLDALRDLVIGAYTVQEMSGQDMSNVPSGIQQIVANIRNPLIPWQQVLSRFFDDSSRDDYSWRKPNKKMLGSGYFPSLYSEALGRVDFAIDVSGSISINEFSQFISEVHKVLSSLAPKKIGIHQFNHRHVATDEVRNLEELLAVEFHGGGGTNVGDTLEVIRNINTKAIVILTDGYLSTSHPIPKVPVIWAVYDNPKFTSDWGQVLHFKLSDLK